MSAGFEHWFDRLATPHTRRHGIKAALAGATALTLPLVRAVPARAADASGCQTGCLWTNGKNFTDAINACQVASSFIGGYVGYAGPGILFAYAAQRKPISEKLTMKCLDVAAIKSRSDAWNCSQPGCPGFNPSQHNGPCDGCAGAGGTCCPDPSNNDTGYSCCTIISDRPECWCLNP